jgi:hypothetical protein
LPARVRAVADADGWLRVVPQQGQPLNTASPPPLPPLRCSAAEVPPWCGGPPSVVVIAAVVAASGGAAVVVAALPCSGCCVARLVWTHGPRGFAAEPTEATAPGPVGALHSAAPACAWPSACATARPSWPVSDGGAVVADEDDDPVTCAALAWASAAGDRQGVGAGVVSPTTGFHLAPAALSSLRGLCLPCGDRDSDAAAGDSHGAVVVVVREGGSA